MPRADGKLSVLFICTGNACRSQMAEGFTRAICGGLIEPLSAGTVAKRLDPRAVAVMAEAGVDISRQRSKSIDDLRDPADNRLPAFDLVVTVCDWARSRCPRFPEKARIVHRGFDDPVDMVSDTASSDELLAHYRRVRDEIKAFVTELPVLIAAQLASESKEVEQSLDEH